jgi:hypothetical protein
MKNDIFWDVTPCGSCKNCSASIIRVTRIGELGRTLVSSNRPSQRAWVRWMTSRTRRVAHNFLSVCSYLTTDRHFSCVTSCTGRSCEVMVRAVNSWSTVGRHCARLQCICCTDPHKISAIQLSFKITLINYICGWSCGWYSYIHTSTHKQNKLRGP